MSDNIIDQMIWCFKSPWKIVWFNPRSAAVLFFFRFRGETSTVPSQKPAHGWTEAELQWSGGFQVETMVFPWENGDQTNKNGDLLGFVVDLW